jgi:hypothetical protein
VISRARFAASVGAIALLGCGASAQAATSLTDLTKRATLDELFKTWKAVCYDNAQDSQAQIDLARSSRFGATEVDSDREDNRAFKSDTYLFFFESNPGYGYCAVSANLDRMPSASDGERLMEPLAGKPLQRDGRLLYWAKPGADYNTMIGFGFGPTSAGTPSALIGSGVDSR